MTSTTVGSTEEARIRAVIDDHTQALRAKDAGRIVGHYADNIVKFDLAPPLQQTGTGEFHRQSLNEWFSTFRGPIGCELRDIRIETEGNIAVFHGFSHISGTRTNGEHTDVWVRLTVCLRKIDGAWKVVHEHVSVPFYMDGSLKAAIDLTP